MQSERAVERMAEYYKDTEHFGKVVGKSQTFTTSNPFDYSQVCWSSAKCEYKTKDGDCKLNHCVGKDSGENG